MIKACFPAFLAVCLLVSPGFSEVFHDDFQRPDASSAGSGWTEFSGNWEIRDHRLRPAPDESGLSKLIAHPDIVLDRAFNIETDIQWLSDARPHWNGIVWHAANSLTYYVLRLRADSGDLQILELGHPSDVMVELEIHHNEAGAVTIPPSGRASLSVRGDGDGTFWWSVTAGGTETHGSFVDETPLAPGFAGVYAAHDGFLVDDFAVSSFEFETESPQPPQVNVSPAVEVHFVMESGLYYRVQSSTDLENWKAETGFFSGTGQEVSFSTLPGMPSGGSIASRFRNNWNHRWKTIETRN